MGGKAVAAHVTEHGRPARRGRPAMRLLLDSGRSDVLGPGGAPVWVVSAIQPDEPLSPDDFRTTGDDPVRALAELVLTRFRAPRSRPVALVLVGASDDLALLVAARLKAMEPTLPLQIEPMHSR